MKKLINNVRKGKSLVALIFLLTIAPLCILYAVNVPIGEENDDGSYDSYEQTTAPAITIADNPKAKAIIDSTNGHLVLFPVKNLGEGEFTVTVKFGIPTQFHEDNHDLLSAEFVDAVGLTFEGNPSIKEVNGEKVLEAIVTVAEGASKGSLAMTFDGEKDETHPDCNVLLLPVEVETFSKEQTGPIGGGREPNWKPHNLNLNTRQKEKDHYGDFDKCVAHVWSSNKLNMAKYLVEYNDHKELFEDPDIVNWKVDGVKQDSFELGIGDQPDPNLVTEFKIELFAKGSNTPIDSMIVTVVPLSTVANFAKWSIDNQDLTWLQSLPALYHKVTIGGDGKAQNPEPSSLTCDLWKNNKPFSLFFDMAADTYYHPDAYHEIRSEEVNGAYGHQACYTKQGGLIRSGVSAGTADKAFYGNTNRADSHVNIDAIPFVWALQLDGTPAQGEDGIAPDYAKIDQPIMHEGWHIGEYLKLRPPIANNKTELEPGNCP